MIKDREGNRYYIVRNAFGIKTFKFTTDNQMIYIPSFFEQILDFFLKTYTGKN